MLKKMLSFVLVITMIFSIGGNAYAMGNSKDDNSKTVEELIKNVNEIKIDENKINDMIKKEGFTYNDAVYYYKLDKLIKYMVDNNVELNLSRAKLYTDSEISRDVNGFRNKILSIDVNAIATAVKNSEIYGKASRKKLESAIKSYGKNLPKKIIIKNPDGSKLEYINDADTKYNSSEGLPADVKLNSDKRESNKDRGEHSAYWGYDSFDKGYGNYVGSASVKFTAPGAYTKLKIKTTTTWKSSGVTVNSVDALTATYGLISVSNKLNYSSGGTATGDVVWVVQGSVGLTFDGVVSFSVAVGASWTELLQKIYSKNGDIKCKTTIYN